MVQTGLSMSGILPADKAAGRHYLLRFARMSLKVLGHTRQSANWTESGQWNGRPERAVREGRNGPVLREARYGPVLREASLREAGSRRPQVLWPPGPGSRGTRRFVQGGPVRPGTPSNALTGLFQASLGGRERPVRLEFCRARRGSGMQNRRPGGRLPGCIPGLTACGRRPVAAL